jgi:hypothetical protein
VVRDFDHFLVTKDHPVRKIEGREGEVDE